MSPTPTRKGNPLKLKIISDGTTAGTRILDTDTGKDIGSDLRCYGVDLTLGVSRGAASCALYCRGVEFEYTGEVAILNDQEVPLEPVARADRWPRARARSAA